MERTTVIPMDIDGSVIESSVNFDHNGSPSPETSLVHQGIPDGRMGDAIFTMTAGGVQFEGGL